MSDDTKYYRLAARVFVDFGATIAAPAVLAALFGKWLDQRYGTEPRYLIILFVVALILTAYLIARKAKVYKRQYESLINKQ